MVNLSSIPDLLECAVKGRHDGTRGRRTDGRFIVAQFIVTPKVSFFIIHPFGALFLADDQSQQLSPKL
jgi:hypothetical protein